jgi:protein tyrosine phosphatase
MSLDKIQLPDFLIPLLFKDSLVITNELQTAKVASRSIEKAVATPAKLFWGDNKKNITIIVNDGEAVYLRESWLQFLTNILAACKLKIGDVAIVNQSKSKKSFADLQSTTAPKYLITFDVSCKDISLPFTIPHYQVQGHSNCCILLCPPLSAMLGNTETVKIEKTKLWVSLKKMFNI